MIYICNSKGDFCMTRNELRRMILNENNGNIYIPDSEKLDLYRRLCIPYYKLKKKKRFITQFLDGVGNELSREKFFECTSSSRLCFELFSWLASYDCVQDIELEYHLPPLKSKTDYKVKGANMDVFCVQNKNIFFIESKFLEDTKNTVNAISKSYYLESNRGNGTKAAFNKEALLDRYWNNYNLALTFPDFVFEMIDYTSKNDFGRTNDCFDLKQMITHMYGICQFIYRNKQKLNGRCVYFYFMRYNMDKGTSDIAAYFKKRTNEMMDDYIRTLGVDMTFVLDYIYTQDYVKTIPSDIKSYGLNTSIFDTLNKYKLYK